MQAKQNKNKIKKIKTKKKKLFSGEQLMNTHNFVVLTWMQYARYPLLVIRTNLLVSLEQIS